MMDDIYAKVSAKAKEISASMDHKNWYPCGNAYLVVKGNSQIVNYLKKHPDSRFTAMKDTYKGGYWLYAKLPWADAFECQNMDYNVKVNEALQTILKEYGIESYVGSYID